MRPPPVFDIPAERPFLDTLAAGILTRATDPETLARTTILLPTRRSARALREAFLRAGEGRAMLLPRMRALAGLSTEDADDLALPALLDLPAAVEPLVRQAVLTGFVRQRPPRHGGPAVAEQAWALAGELARLFDEIALEERDMALLARPGEAFAEEWLARLKALVPETHARHWEITLIFLRGIVADWNAWLQENGLIDIGVRRVRALLAQAEAWRADPPTHPIIAAGIGIGGTVPAAVALLGAILTLPHGAVVLHGIDQASAGAVWGEIAKAPTHPFSSQVLLLDALGIARADVAPWPAPDGARKVPARRAELIGMALRPPAGTAAWTRPDPIHWRDGLGGLSLLAAPEPGAEADAIALLLRETLEVKGARAALVTPDRDLARRVSAALVRHGITADDSAGEPFGETPAGGFLRLLVRAVAEGFAPVPLLALAKHPLAAAGMDRFAWLSAWRALERAALRGPRPAAGLDALREAARAGMRRESQVEVLARVLGAVDALATALGPLPALMAGEADPAALLDAVMAAAEALAATDAQEGGLRLYAGAEGEPLALHVAAMAEGFAHLPSLPPAQFPGLFEAALAQGVARSGRASRGRTGAPHPRVEILGLLEARLLSFDRVVLGALDESIWPLATDPGPWMSRPMRREFGLPEPEARIGRVAADFLLTACAAPEAVLTRSIKRGGAPTVPARWLVRLETFLRGQGLRLEPSEAAGWAQALDAAPIVTPCARPAPNPPLDARPLVISLSDVATLLADPYALYAKRVLKLQRLDALDADIGGPDYGELVHAAMARFIRALDAEGWTHVARARALFDTAMEDALAEHGPRPAYAAFWRPRLRRIGDFAIAEEARARADILRSHVEIDGRMVLAESADRAIELTARADRIDVLRDGTLSVLDYKTGQLPKKTEPENGAAPQLPLEAFMAIDGAFRGLAAGAVSLLAYWRLSGGEPPGEAGTVRQGAEAVQTLAFANADAAAALVGRYLLERRPFTARPHPLRAARGGEYDHLSRIAEWAGAEDGE
ncbi:double-strand break repair protein AddB [Plastoroseomonas arctica]|uniref:Double-strand break repair protein AddB n=1 Tax=Plastoroseomonas arctica TaxID=1509237 RepID=A0AAF1JXR6_9PROT|nr:double-strand break repair protein AddB [Plastoroseomonas arctica]MBR0654291.1 double-strand break repair protein AddB [Plastoroseomonas arctica]